MNRSDAPEDDIDDMASELAELGMQTEAIDAWQDAADAALDAALAEEGEPEGLLEENVTALRVLQHCQWDFIAGMQGARYAGISASEIAAVMDPLDVPKAERARVLGDVRFCVAVALPVLNRE